ncbi:MAG TPA: AMP-binding protein [Usitatibacter sp.]
MTSFFDALEARDPRQREADLLARLPAQVAHAQANAAFYRKALAGVDARSIGSRAALAGLPVTRKADLVALQEAERPFGGLNATPPSGLARIFMSPGPIYEPEGRRPDFWHAARTLHAAGFRSGDVVLNCFSYHLTPAGSMFETGLHHIGCAVIPGGVGQTELQARAIADLAPSGYVGTPSFLKLIIEKCDELGLASSSVRRALVSGEAFMPAVRSLLAQRGIEGYQAYGTADLGMVAYETAGREGLVLNEDMILEIVRPGTGEPLPDGEVGEVVVTPFNVDYPVVRFATGDLSAVLPGPSPCGRTNTRIKGWMGRADQTTKVKGMFVHPAQVAEIAGRHPDLGRVRLVVSREAEQDTMTLHAEAAAAGPALAEAIAATLQSVTRVRGAVKLVAPGSLPNDGKVIADERPVG